jgi:hypothetical protein
MQGFLTNLVLPGILPSVANITGTIAVTNTIQYVRTGASALRQPWVILQGS